jgi:uncharacterized protein YuzE
MEITYDKSGDSVYIYTVSSEYRPKGVAKTVPLEDYPSVILDFTKDGRLFGIEILDASKMIDVEYLKKLEFKRIDASKKHNL